MCREDGRCLQVMTLIAACTAAVSRWLLQGTEVLDVALWFSNDGEQVGSPQTLVELRINGLPIPY